VLPEWAIESLKQEGYRIVCRDHPIRILRLRFRCSVPKTAYHNIENKGFVVSCRSGDTTLALKHFGYLLQLFLQLGRIFGNAGLHYQVS
jgi:hypothetical protein